MNYVSHIWQSVATLLIGMRVTMGHLLRIRKGFVTLQYPVERWPRPEKNIGFSLDSYNVIRSRLTVDMDDCIGCLKCERACPVDCIKIDTVKVDKGQDIPEANHRGVTSNGTQKRLLVTRIRKMALLRNQMRPHPGPSMRPGMGLCHPPRNTTEATPATMNILAYSASMKNAQRMPEYSV